MGSPISKFEHQHKENVCKVKNIMVNDKYLADTLHKRAKQQDAPPCTQVRCKASMMNPLEHSPRKLKRTKKEVLSDAREFLHEFYTTKKREEGGYEQRLKAVEAAIRQRGEYELTTEELTFGARTAWRNAARCIGRKNWNSLEVFDRRQMSTAEEMFTCICEHIKWSNNNGAIRPAISVFPHRRHGQRDFRVWNALLIRYAGYAQTDGSVIGDPAGVELTKIALGMGWQGKGGRFDVLPLILQAREGPIQFFELPEEIVMEVTISHPQYDWFADLGLKWYGLPCVSCLILDVGGLEFTGAPFSGWYMGTEVSARDICDTGRYNMLEPIAQGMGLDTTVPTTLWKDKAQTEASVAVLYSFQKAHVTIIDHHTASASFLQHMEKETQLRGGCPGDWIWIVPPQGGSTTGVFHQEMLNYKLKPSFEYQEDPWKGKESIPKKRYHVATKHAKNRMRKRPMHQKFRIYAKAVLFAGRMMRIAMNSRKKCVILYATEMGNSKAFAEKLYKAATYVLNPKCISMCDYDVTDLVKEDIILVVTSTYGNGDPPDNGKVFAEGLRNLIKDYERKKNSAPNGGILNKGYNSSYGDADDNDSDDDNNRDRLGLDGLSRVMYSVLALGSTAYKNFCAFGHRIDEDFTSLGAQPICDIVEADELRGQNRQFKQWTANMFLALHSKLGMDTEGTRYAIKSCTNQDQNGKAKLMMSLEPPGTMPTSLDKGLSGMHDKKIVMIKVVENIKLTSPHASSDVHTLQLDISNYDTELVRIEAGDHVAIFPMNSQELVQNLITKLPDAPDPSRVFTLQNTSKALKGKLPKTNLQHALSYYLDITAPPTQYLLRHLAKEVRNSKEKKEITTLAKDFEEYCRWRKEVAPTIPELFDLFPSLEVSTGLLLSHLPKISPRVYSATSPHSHCLQTVTFNTVDYFTPHGLRRRGLCSSWLGELQAGEYIPCSIKPNPAFHVPGDPTTPLLLIGAGVGIAVYIGFLEERQRQAHGCDVKAFGRVVLYTGLRSRKDKIFSKRLDKFLREDILTDVHYAYSREPAMEKVYVQDLLHRDGQAISQFLTIDGAHVYISGNSDMAADVYTMLAAILADNLSITQRKATSYLLSMKERGRYHEDAFGETKPPISKKAPATATSAPSTSMPAPSTFTPAPLNAMSVSSITTKKHVCRIVL